VLVVVDHLVLDAEPFALALGVLDAGDPVLDAVVAAGGEFPVPFHLEAGVLLLGDKEAGALLRGQVDDAAFFGGPAGRGLVAVGIGEIFEGEFDGFGCDGGADGEEREQEVLHGGHPPWPNPSLRKDCFCGWPY
jgi:hypothetical protein